MDYTLADQAVTFDGSQSQMCVDLMTTDDNIYEFDETILLQLATDSPTLNLAPSMANVTIFDDDQGN